MPMPSAIAPASGIHDADGREARAARRRGRPAGRRARRRAARRRRARARSRATETISASAAISRRTWRGVAPRARSTAVSRRRWAIASANVPATTNSATAPAIPASAPNMAISVSRSPASGEPGSASAACCAVEHLDAGSERVRPAVRAARSGVDAVRGDDADRGHVAGSAGERARLRGAEEQRRLVGVAARHRVRDAADAERAGARGRGDLHAVADAQAEAGLGDDVARPGGRGAARRARTASAPRRSSRARGRAPRRRRPPRRARRRGTRRRRRRGRRPAPRRPARPARHGSRGAGSTSTPPRSPPSWTVGSARTTASAAA